MKGDAMIDLIPVDVIQVLHQRQADLTHELQTLEETRQREARIKTELAHIATLLRDYPVLGDDQEHTEDPSLPTEALPEGPPAPENPPEPPILDYLDAILRERGPSRAADLRRQLHERYGVDKAESSFHGLLNKAKNAGRYAQRGSIWRLVSLTEEPTP
jgi:hypothetical protein